MRRFGLAAPLLLLLAGRGLLTAPYPAQRSDAGPGARVPGEEELALAAELRSYLNETRFELGLGLLGASRHLDLLAYQHAAEMADRGQVTHHSYRFGVGTANRLKLAFPLVFQFAENVAMNRNPRRVHEALLASRGHRLNRLDPEFTHVGVGIARADRYRLFVTELFVRATDPEAIGRIDVLYTEAPDGTLPQDEARHGEVIAETVSIPPPGANDPEFWTQRGIDAFVAGRFDEAVAHFEHALAIDPDYPYARFDLGRALLSSDRASEALATLDRYLALHPDDIDALASSGSAALLGQQYARAEQSFRRVLRVRTRDAGTWYNLGLALEYQDRPREAENAYAQALHLDAKLVVAAAGLARVQR